MFLISHDILFNKIKYNLFVCLYNSYNFWYFKSQKINWMSFSKVMIYAQINKNILKI